MSIDFRGLVEGATLDSPAPDPITGAGYITVPQPDGLSVGDMMIAVTAASEDDSHTGLIPVGAGWTTVAGTGWDGGNVWVSYKTATSADVAAGTLQFGPSAVDAIPPVIGNVVWLAYDGGVKTVTVVFGTAASDVSATARVDGVAVTIYTSQGTVGSAGDPPTVTGTSVTQRASYAPWSDSAGTQIVPGITICDEPVSASASSVASFAGDDTSDVTAYTGIVLMLEGNHAPRVPTVTKPVFGSTFITLDDIPLALTALQDIDPGDSASAVDYRYRVIGAGSWTALAGSLDGTGTIPGGTLTADDYEIQGQYEDQASAASGWSASRNFTVSVPAISPVLTTPTSGATITTPTAALDWTVIDQDEWESRVVADDTGTADPSTVYWDSGLTDSSSARTATASYPVNNVAAHLQLRVLYDGAYSAWVDVPVTVNHAAPNEPTITGITTSRTQIQVDWTCDVDSLPSDATSITLFASSDDFVSRFPIAVNQPTSGSFIWELPASGVDYSFIVAALNDYGVGVESAPAGSATGTADDLRTVMYVAGGAPTE